MEQNMDLRHLGNRNLMNELCTEYTELCMFGMCYESSFSIRGDKGYFLRLYIKSLIINSDPGGKQW